ncbi:MAG TPA: ribonuclease [Gammaproteobacteria bacterium]|nr:ribonuclease [Gammaproteobacteria bacterium]
MSLATADLTDEHPGLQVLELALRDFGGCKAFHGPVTTLKVFEDNSLVRAAFEEPGAGRVLVVDGGGSLRCALVGDLLAELAAKNGWAGAVVYGAIRDSAPIASIAIGLKALATHPRKSVKRGEGQRDIPVSFGGLTIRPGDYLYADADGVVVGPAAVHGAG